MRHHAMSCRSSGPSTRRFLKKLAANALCLSFVSLMGVSNQVAVVVPCLNEARTIQSLVREIRQFLPVTLVVDDGSADGTPREATQAGAEVLRHPVSRGKGAALQTGFSSALDRGFEWALTMDGDGQHASADIPAFLRRLEHSSAAMIIGNRMANAAAMPVIRRAVNRWMSDQIGAFCGTALPDSQCGFRLVHLPTWKRFQFSARRFEIESELIVRFVKAGLPIEFIPVQTRYATERSKIRPVRDTLRWFRWWTAIRRELAFDHAATPGHFAPSAQDATA
jgi:glycosyltransferase involved in cell wall biosynthesis